eukprot:PITA_32392
MDVSYDCELNLSTDFEPTSFKEAFSHDEWKEAMQKEHDALIKNDTWKLVDPPLGTKPIGCKWVYKNKYKADGSLDKHKAKLVAKDDFLMTRNNGSYIASIKKELRKGFEMIDLGYVHYYLGIEVIQHPKYIFLSQKKYIGDLLNRFGMAECNPLITPMEQNLKLTSIEGKEFEDATRYIQLVGSVNYMTTTRPDISFAVGILSRFMQKPCEGHLSIAKGVLKYLKGTQDFGLKYTQVGDFNLIGYSDSNFDGGKETGVSTSGYAMSLGSGAVSWRSHKQLVRVDSTTKAEYVAIAEATKEIVWLRKILEDLQVKQVHSTPLMLDITSAIELAKNPKFHDRTKHINTKYHLIRHHVDAKTIHLHHCSTNEQIVDIFTKTFGREKFKRFKTMLGLINIPLD